MRGFAVFGLLGLLLGSALVTLSIDEASTLPAAATGATRTVPLGGGTATFGAGLVAGERFLKQVEWPEHLKHPYTPDSGTEQPGDGHDDALLTLERRYTDRSYMERAWTGGLRLVGVHGTPDAPVCVCDIELISYNESGLAPVPRGLILLDTSYILMDNVTMYGIGMDFEDSHHLTITRSRFIDTNGIVAFWADDVLYTDNIMMRHGGATEWYNHPMGGTAGITECWPDPRCTAGVISIAGGSRWTIEWSYFYGDGGIGGSGGKDLKIHHNSIYGGGINSGTGDSEEITWNLLRGWGGFGIGIYGPTGRVENNSVVLYAEVDPLTPVVTQAAGVDAAGCPACLVHNNDLIVYAGRPTDLPDGNPRRVPALRNDASTINADDNFWGTVHDPRTPAGVWIQELNSGRTTLARWALQPIHDVTPLAPILNPQDAPYWVERITGQEIAPPSE